MADKLSHLLDDVNHFRGNTLKKLAIVLAFMAGLVSPSFAQTGTSKTQSAMAAEVNAIITDNVTGGISPFDARQVLLDMVSSVAFFNSNPPPNPAFPGNAPYYFTIPNPANGYTTIYNGMQVSMGAPILATSQFGSNTVGIQQALVGTISIATGDVAGNAGFAIAGYGISNSTATGAVGVGGFAMCGIQNCNEIDGANQVVANAPTLQNGVGFDFTLMLGNQVNINLRQKSGGANPSGPLYGYYVVGGGNATNNTGNAYAADQLSIITGAKWSNSFASFNGAALVALSVGTISGTAGSPPATSGSQTIQFTSYNSSVGKISTISTDTFGNIILSPNLNVGAATALEDGLGNVIFTSGTTGNAVAIAGTTTNPALSFTICGTNCGWLAPAANKLELVVNAVDVLDFGVTNGANSWTFGTSAVNVFVPGIFLAQANVAATTTANGAARILGGLGVTGAGYFGGEVVVGITTVASLPTCNAAHKSARYFVTDQATAVSYLGAVTGSGATQQAVTCDGTNWKQG